jgi:putative tricarboxylic transport membrane protein
MEYLLIGVSHIFNIQGLLYLSGGVLMGIIFGAIPGLTATLGIALLLPFTYAMGPFHGISTLIGIYVGATSGGLISATLIGIPGTGASVVTTIDGFPMAKKGLANQALSLGVFSSLIGGLFSAIVLILIAPSLAEIALKFGPWEYFALGIFGLSVIISISGKDIVKGFLAALIGIAITLVGQDPVLAIPRYTFGNLNLNGGFALLPTLLGFFAMAQVFSELKNVTKGLDKVPFDKHYRIFPAKSMILKSKFNFLRSSIIGTLIGILPGAGASIASFIAYDQTKKASKTPELFGTGHYEGVVASETANNAVTGGALVPMMTLAIPGDMVTAMIMGGLTIHGLQPGPLLFINNGDVVGAIFVALLTANIMMFLYQSVLMRFFAKIIIIPKHILLPLVIVFCTIGCYTTSFRIGDLWFYLVFGLIGYILAKHEFPLGPIVLGYILGPIIERYWRLGVMSQPNNLALFVTRPISLILLLGAIFSMVYGPVKDSLKKAKRKK